jgi:hypothetical protein
MFYNLGRSGVVFLCLCAALACSAQDAADHQVERLNVHRLPNGFVEITAAQQVLYPFSFCHRESFVNWFDCHVDMVIHTLLTAGGIVIYRGSAYFLRSISTPAGSGCAVVVPIVRLY